MELPSLNRHHLRRLREIYRSAGWPCQDMLEVELLAAGLVERVTPPQGLECLRVTDAGIRQLAQTFAGNKAARSPHETLVEQVALAMARAGRLAWRGLALRVQVPVASEAVLPPGAHSAHEPLFADAAPAWPDPGERQDQVWCMACPDVFSIRHSSVEAYLEPVVHEIKVSRADLLGDIKKPAKRAAYLGLASACWYVLGQDARGRPIGGPDDVPPECGVLLSAGGQLTVAREAPRRAVERLPFHVWMALAKAGPAWREDEPGQAAF
ncbi:MAG: hypothetical protein Q8K24_06980 [Hydrogenophaga sp.]|nr:hypothetical protein [Hydrogenophaga sp.]